MAEIFSGIFVSKVFQFRITFVGTKPEIWRRIQVPFNYTFWELHAAIKDAIQWHEHKYKSAIWKQKFVLNNPETGTIDEIYLPDIECSLQFLHFLKPRSIILENPYHAHKYFVSCNDQGSYVDNHYNAEWEIGITLEKILTRPAEMKFPLCISGERAAPLSRFGNVSRYNFMMEAIANKQHRWHRKCLSKLPRNFDPNIFMPHTVIFTDPFAYSECCGCAPRRICYPGLNFDFI